MLRIGRTSMGLSIIRPAGDKNVDIAAIGLAPDFCVK